MIDQYTEFAVRHISSIPTEVLIQEIHNRGLSPNKIDDNWGDCTWCPKRTQQKFTCPYMYGPASAV